MATDRLQRLLAHSRLAIIAIGVTAVLAIGFAAERAGATGATGRAKNGRIAWKGFLDARLSKSAIFAANPDGTHRVQLTRPAHGVMDDLPDWSPDGSTILFERGFQTGADAGSITVPDQTMRVNADGSGLTKVGACSGACRGNDDPSYSPDGGRIVISRLMLPAQAGGNPALGIWIMNSDGSDLRQVTQQQQPTTSEDHEPAWSPDGTQLIFTRINDTANPVDQQALFIVASAGGQPHRITRWNLNAGGANWSPDGRRILFQSYRDCHCPQTSQVYAVNPDGTHLTKLTHRGRNIEPTWSPDGRQILFGHQPGTGPDQSADIWRMPAQPAHGDHTAVVTSDLWESEPDWGTAHANR